jgi:uncharacterized protein
VQAPFRMPERALEEMVFGRDHGAVALHVAGVRHGFGVASPCYYPLYEQAQELDMTVAVHVGGDIRVYQRAPEMFLLNNIAPVAGALHSVVMTNLHERFPRLRWAFLEAGASWLPFALQEAFRTEAYGALRSWKDWRMQAEGVLADRRLFVACQMDDDLPYLLGLAGEGNLVHGTDFGHLDVGSDPDGLRLVLARTDVPDAQLRRIVDGNARRLYGIDESFRPADAAQAALTT